MRFFLVSTTGRACDVSLRMFRPSQFRTQAFGNAYVPQRKIFWWWKNLSVPVASMEAARKIILEHHPAPRGPEPPRKTR